MTEKQIEDAIEVIEECLEYSGKTTVNTIKTLINYLKANVDDILDVGFLDEEEL
jgi:hypothetical protein